MANLVYMPASKLADLLHAVGMHNEVYVVLRDNQLALGSDPLKPTSLVDFSAEAIRSFNGPGPEYFGVSPPEVPRSPLSNWAVSRASRQSGDYWFEIQGKRGNCRSLKELVLESLRSLEGFVPGTLEKLSNIKARSRRIVARDRTHLYDKKHLAEKFAEELMPGWWYGTNNSAQQVESWLRHACRISGLKWGQDFKISLTAGL